MDSYAKLTIPELIVELKRRQLKQAGNKPDLVRRLQEDDWEKLPRPRQDEVDLKIRKLTEKRDEECDMGCQIALSKWERSMADLEREAPTMTNELKLKIIKLKEKRDEEYEIYRQNAFSKWWSSMADIFRGHESDGGKRRLLPDHI